MGKDIYDAVNAALKDSLPPAQLPDAQKGWQKLSAAIAQGVVNHLKANLQISVSGIATTGTLGNDGKTVKATQDAAVSGQVQ
jgi:nicotinamide mononucleotide (NMN) deamidase PncC